jgi:tetratricopeptide (TPR) repeat protein
MKTLHLESATIKTVAISILAALLGVLPTPAAPTAGAACSAEQGQRFIDEGRYDRAVREFTCVIENDPTGIEGYRGRIEAQLLLGRYSDALGDYARVTALVVPVHPDAADVIVAGYAARLAVAPENIPALTGASFARWWRFDYASAIHLLNQLLEVKPNDAFGNLFRGSSRLLHGATQTRGVADIERALVLDSKNPHARFIVADAYTYGLPEPQRAFAEAMLALNGGLDTPRIRAILADAYAAFGDRLAAAAEIQTHIEMVTTELLPASPLPSGASLSLDLVPGRTYEIPVDVVAGQPLGITTGSKDFWDSILVLLAPDGTPVLGSDDDNFYFAAFEWIAETTGTYRVQVTSFESINTGKLIVTRD